MKISNIRKNSNSGFTLIELVIVIAGLAALGSFTFPNILSSKSKEERNFLFHVLKFAKSFTTIRSKIYRFPFNLSSPPSPNNFC